MTESIGIATLTLNPAIDQSVAIPGFTAGAVNRVDWERSDPGGKGVNAASFLSELGFRVTVTGFLGRDNSAVFEALFRDQGLQDRFVRLPGNTRVNVKIIDEAQHRITDINFPGLTAGGNDLANLRDALLALVTDHQWFVLSGSLPTGVPVGFYAELVGLLKGAGKRVVLDTSGEPLREAIAAAPFVIKPNVAELEESLGVSLPSRGAVIEAARSLVKAGIERVVVSMGQDGALFVSAQECLLALPPTVQVKSTVGAGDAMVAGFVAASIRGGSLADAARLATATAVGALTQLGPRLPPPQTLASLVQQVTVQAIAA
jgi:1-phosphofructokinase family hexose kinase